MNSPQTLGPYFRILHADQEEIQVGIMETGYFTRLNFKRSIGLADFELATGEARKPGSLPLYYFRAAIINTTPPGGPLGLIDNRENITVGTTAARHQITTYQDPFNPANIFIKHKTYLTLAETSEVVPIALETHYNLHSDGMVYVYVTLTNETEYSLTLGSISQGIYFGDIPAAEYQDAQNPTENRWLGKRGDLTDEFNAKGHNASFIAFQYPWESFVAKQFNPGAEPPYSLLVKSLVNPIIAPGAQIHFTGFLPIGGFGMINPEHPTAPTYLNQITLYKSDYLNPWPGTFIVGQSITNDLGDLDGDGFNEGTGHYVILAAGGQASWTQNPLRGGATPIPFVRPKYKIRGLMGYECLLSVTGPGAPPVLIENETYVLHCDISSNTTFLEFLVDFTDTVTITVEQRLPLHPRPNYFTRYLPRIPKEGDITGISAEVYSGPINYANFYGRFARIVSKFESSPSADWDYEIVRGIYQLYVRKGGDFLVSHGNRALDVSFDGVTAIVPSISQISLASVTSKSKPSMTQFSADKANILRMAGILDGLSYDFEYGNDCLFFKIGLNNWLRDALKELPWYGEEGAKLVFEWTFRAVGPPLDTIVDGRNLANWTGEINCSDHLEFIERNVVLHRLEPPVFLGPIPSEGDRYKQQGPLEIYHQDALDPTFKARVCLPVDTLESIDSGDISIDLAIVFLHAPSRSEGGIDTFGPDVPPALFQGNASCGGIVLADASVLPSSPIDYCGCYDTFICKDISGMLGDPDIQTDLETYAEGRYGTYKVSDGTPAENNICRRNFGWSKELRLGILRRTINTKTVMVPHRILLKFDLEHLPNLHLDLIPGTLTQSITSAKLVLTAIREIADGQLGDMTEGYRVLLDWREGQRTIPNAGVVWQDKVETDGAAKVVADIYTKLPRAGEANWDYASHELSRWHFPGLGVNGQAKDYDDVNVMLASEINHVSADAQLNITLNTNDVGHRRILGEWTVANWERCHDSEDQDWDFTNYGMLWRMVDESVAGDCEPAAFYSTQNFGVDVTKRPMLVLDGSITEEPPVVQKVGSGASWVGDGVLRVAYDVKHSAQYDICIDARTRQELQQLGDWNFFTFKLQNVDDLKLSWFGREMSGSLLEGKEFKVPIIGYILRNQQLSIGGNSVFYAFDPWRQFYFGRVNRINSIPVDNNGQLDPSLTDTFTEHTDLAWDVWAAFRALGFDPDDLANSDATITVKVTLTTEMTNASASFESNPLPLNAIAGVNFNRIPAKTSIALRVLGSANLALESQWLGGYIDEIVKLMEESKDSGGQKSWEQGPYPGVLNMAWAIPALSLAYRWLQIHQTDPDMGGVRPDCRWIASAFRIMSEWLNNGIWQGSNENLFDVIMRHASATPGAGWPIGQFPLSDPSSVDATQIDLRNYVTLQPSDGKIWLGVFF